MRKERHFTAFGAAWLFLSGIVIGIDRCTKTQALFLPYGQPEEIWGSWVRWRLAFNEGVAFGIGHGAPGLIALSLLMLSLCLTAVLLIWLLTIQAPRWQSAAAVSLILGGALGNIWDRLAFGYVIDFIDIGVHHWRWPTFNIADICISFGALWLCWQTCKK